MDGIQSTVAAAGTDREVSLAPMFFGCVLCVQHDKFKGTALILATAKAISSLVVVSLLPLGMEILLGIICTYPRVTNLNTRY